MVMDGLQRSSCIAVLFDVALMDQERDLRLRFFERRYTGVVRSVAKRRGDAQRCTPLIALLRGDDVLAR